MSENTSPYRAVDLARDPFRPTPAPEAVDPVDEVLRIRRRNVQRWIARHGVAYSVDAILARAAVAGDEVAMAEARAGNLPNVGGGAVISEEPGRSSPGTSGQVIRPTLATAPRRASPQDRLLQQSSPEGFDDEW